MSLAPVCPDCLAPPPVFVAEHFCELCRTPFLNASPLDERGLCALCRSGVTAFQAAYSYGAYEGRLRTLIHLFKYRGMTPLAAPMSAWLARALPRDASFDAIVPMPLHWWRFLRRGFNQSALLAAGLSRITGLPAVRALARVRATAPQASFTHAARRANVRGAFRVRLPRFVPGRRLLLLDDVLTTGATVNEAAAALRRAGAASVAVLTLARVDRRQLHRVFELSAVDSLSRGPLP
jgi:ComF family protein